MLVAVGVLAAIVSRPNGPVFTPETFTGVLLSKSGTAATPPAAGNAGTPPAKRFSISGSIVDLYPGATATLTLRFSNPLPQDIVVMTADVTVVSTDKPGCSTSSVAATSYAAPSGGGVAVPKRGTATVGVPISMRASADDACSGATFSLAYAGTAVPK